MLEGVHKKFENYQHTEIYLLALNEQNEARMELFRDSFLFLICQTKIVWVRQGKILKCPVLAALVFKGLIFKQEI